ncbi:hypothetical protein [Streptomyces sp. 5-10]|uniref:hypothetical protein n=1 Tax=Streptomyces sp. 5-10 TaxID=878925 RepID=UPI00168AAD89|nr:hypothetical protein [Streptomyces sp. 5-10]MBD3004880.1 hypothetical protein [Streptomyces sp. 5-10]
MTGVDLEEKARIREFVRGTALKAITGSSGNPAPDSGFSLMTWLASAVYEKLDRDFAEAAPVDAAGPGSLAGDVLSGFKGGFVRYFPDSSLLLIVRVVPVSYIRSVRTGLISSPDLERSRELAHAIQGAGVACERTAVAYIPFDSNKVSDIKLAPGSDPVAKDLVHAVVTRPSERGLQRMPGPSDLADPCDVCLARKIAHFLGIDPDPEDENFSLKAWVGTSVHEKLERDLPKVYDGAQLEITVSIADIPGLGLVSGHVDSYFPERLALNDWKTGDLSGTFGVKRMRTDGVKTAYLRQTMLYCYGMRQSGLPVEWANLTFIPRDSNRASDIWTATCSYREDVAVFALNRAESLVDVVKSGDRHTLEPDLEAPCFKCVVLPRLLG